MADIDFVSTAIGVIVAFIVVLIGYGLRKLMNKEINLKVLKDKVKETHLRLQEANNNLKELYVLFNQLENA